MTAIIVQFPGVFVRKANEGGWLVLARDHGWLHGDRQSAIRDARWLSRNLHVPMREISQ
jgi:hypothetical protein